jgi:hypothetical protein
MSERPFDSLSEEENTAVTALESGLSQALEIKVELALSPKRTKYFFFKADTFLDGDMMECDMS